MTTKRPPPESGTPTSAERQEEQHTGQSTQDRQRLNDAIGKRVVDTLGRPGGLHTTQVRWLWDNRYRVNVFVGADAASAKVAHSYFLTADDDGNILESVPQLTKQY